MFVLSDGRLPEETAFFLGADRFLAFLHVGTRGITHVRTGGIGVLDTWRV